MKALILYTCNNCRKYPVKVLEEVGEHKKGHCPACGSENLSFEKAYATDDQGIITE